MSMQEVVARVTSGPRADRQFTVKFDLPETISEALGRWPEEVVYSRFKASLVIDLQAFIRAQISKEDFDPSTLQQKVDEWKPEVRAKGQTLSEKVQDMLSKLSPEDRANLLAEFN